MITNSLVDSSSLATNYALLREKIEQAGLLSKSPAHYLPYFLMIGCGIVFGLWVLTKTHNFFLVAMDAIFLGFLFAQVAFLGHDIAHKQVFRSPAWQRIIGTFWFGGVFGGSMRWWTRKHDLHHTHPNEIGMDPDVGVPLSFSREHRDTFTGIYAFIAHYQRILFFPILSVARASLFFESVRDFFRNHDRTAAVEASLCLIHFVVYFSFVFYILPLATALMFIVIVFWVQSINLGLSFAPNHKGMPLLPKDTALDFMTRQVITARNIHPGTFTDFFYGGLNYQIEHHLFPMMPRHHLQRAHKITKEFCEQGGFTYHEVGPVESLLEIYQSFYTSTVKRGDLPPSMGVEVS